MIRNFLFKEPSLNLNNWALNGNFIFLNFLKLSWLSFLLPIFLFSVVLILKGRLPNLNNFNDKFNYMGYAVFNTNVKNSKTTVLWIRAAVNMKEILVDWSYVIIYAILSKSHWTLQDLLNNIRILLKIYIYLHVSKTAVWKGKIHILSLWMMCRCVTVGTILEEPSLLVCERRRNRCHLRKCLLPMDL